MGIANDMMEQYHEALRERNVAEERAGRFLIQRDELAEALRILYLETADYITLNHLGDVHHNHSMQMARDALENAVSVRLPYRNTASSV